MNYNVLYNEALSVTRDKFLSLIKQKITDERTYYTCISKSPLVTLNYISQHPELSQCYK